MRIDPDGIAAVTRLAAWDEPLSDRAVMAQSLAATPLVQFAASELSARDARRTGALATGSIRALLRTRGRGQGGTIVAASGQGGTLYLDIDAGGLSYRVLPGEDSSETEPLIEARAPGHWDDGTWHDVVVTSGRGAVEIHVDGYQVALVPGGAFLADIAPVTRVVVGADLDGRRLFGEAQTAMIYDAALTDAQVKRLAGAAPLPTRALFDTGYHGARSYRIPSLLTLDSGVILAGADQRVSIPNDAPNDINLVMRRSLDGRRHLAPPPGHQPAPLRLPVHGPAAQRRRRPAVGARVAGALPHHCATDLADELALDHPLSPHGPADPGARGAQGGGEVGENHPHDEPLSLHAPARTGTRCRHASPRPARSAGTDQPRLRRRLQPRAVG